MFIKTILSYIAEIFLFTAHNKATAQVASGAVIGITATSVTTWNEIAKLIISVMTILFIGYKWRKEHKKKDKQNDNI